MAITERYVTTGGGTGAGTEGDPWSIEHAAVTAVASDRVNILKGTYTLAANLTLANGADETPIYWRGYNSTIGDLEAVGRPTATAALTITNFPVIDVGASYTITMGTSNQLSNLRCIGSKNDAVIHCGADPVVWRCSLHNSNTTGAASETIDLVSNYGSVTDCDCSIATDNSGGNCIANGRGSVIGCRIWHTATPGTATSGIELQSTAAHMSNCILFNWGDAIVMASLAGSVTNNTVYNCANGIHLNTTAALIANNIFFNLSAYVYKGPSGGNDLILNNAWGDATSGEMNTDLGTTLFAQDSIALSSNDPFTDAASEDFTIDSGSTGGALVANASQFWGGSIGTLGAVPLASGGGSGGGTKIAGFGGGVVG